MPKSLIVPGVSIATEFDVAPPLPARSGILGAVGVVDDGSGGVGSATTRQDVLAQFGPATLYSFPELFRALANGVSEVVVSPVSPTSGQVASAVLLGDAGDEVLKLRARAVGPWGNNLSVRVTRHVGTDGTVRNVRIDVLWKGQVIETHDGLVLHDTDDRDLFTAINRDSKVIVALDPVFETDLPVRDLAPVAFLDGPAAPAGGVLTKGGSALIQVQAKTAGAAGNDLGVVVRDGRDTVTLNDGAVTPAPAVKVTARAPGHDPLNPTTIQIVANPTAGGVDASVVFNKVLRTYTGLTGIKALVDALNSDPGVRAEAIGTVLPAVTAGAVTLAATRTVTVHVETVRSTNYNDLASATDIIAKLNTDGGVVASLAPAAAGTDLPDATAANDIVLTAGRDAGLARDYAGQNNPTATVLTLVPVDGTNAAATRFQISAGTRPSTVRVTAGIAAGTGFQVQESFDSLTMDPDSDRFLVAVLKAQSKLLSPVERILRTHSGHFPVDAPAVTPLAGGMAPTAAAYQDAIDALAGEDAVDLVMAGLQEWADPNLNGVAVQQALLAHARTQADNARPRIVLGSVSPAESNDVRAILDHATRVTDRRFVLCAPSGSEGAVAGLLGHLEFFQSPTFKTVADPGVALVPYTDSDLNKLVGPDGNVCVVRARRGRGTVVIKGIATDGFQISVTRVADRCVREVKAIADRFIGELNNADSRNALKQMIVATFTQLERDGALVPSVDGKSPAFVVEVYASQNDTAGGIVRIDIAVRPVRAIDYVYATIRIKN